MKLHWEYLDDTPEVLRTFLKKQDISKRLLAKIKYAGGKIVVNNKEETVRYILTKGDIIAVQLPIEHAQDNVLVSHEPIDVLYEDDFVLAVNKPAGVISIPSYANPNYSMANRVKGYYIRQEYTNQVIHVVTRLDKDTSGVMLFAKHQFAHALLDKQLRAGNVDKRYVALTKQKVSSDRHGWIDEPIARDEQSIMIRRVAHDGSGKKALTEFWQQEELPHGIVYDIKLHTGRTHQIRVHFNYKGATLIGDDLYGGDMSSGLMRQALHCQQLIFCHPLTKKSIVCIAKLPEDMQSWLDKEREVVYG